MIRENEIRNDYRRFTKYLIEKGMTFTTMESCTSGQVISFVTDTEGSSSVVKGAYVTYSNEAKVMQGVPKEIIETYGVYSVETAKAMAETCRRNFQANIGVGVTGTFGNVDPNNADSQEGKVFFAIDIDGEVQTYERDLERQESRYGYKVAIAGDILKELWLLLT